MLNRRDDGSPPTPRLPGCSPLPRVFGPESIEFDRHGRGPYAGLADGRVVRWMGEEAGWETFAVMNPDWSEKVCANGVNSTTSNQHNKEQFCGRPLGLRFHRETGVIYIADAYYGLMVIGRSGGVATSLAQEAGGSEYMSRTFRLALKESLGSWLDHIQATWEEKNLNSWANGRIKKDLLGSLHSLEFPTGKASIYEVSKCSRDTFQVTVGNKERVGYNYELNFKFRAIANSSKPGRFQRPGR